MRGRESTRPTAFPPVSKETRQMNASATRQMNAWARTSCLLRRGSLATLAACIGLFAAMLAAAPAQAEYGVNGFDFQLANRDGSPVTQAGSHPYAVTIPFEVNSTETGFFEWTLSGATKDFIAELPPGLIGNATAVPRCSDLDFLQLRTDIPTSNATQCPDSTVAGIVAVSVLGPIAWYNVPLYNLAPGPGSAARLGLVVQGVPVTFDIGVKPGSDYNVIAAQRHTPQPVKFFGAVAQIWGDPSDPGHDMVRGKCGLKELFFVTLDQVSFPSGPFAGPGGCPVQPLEKAFLTLPSSCTGPLTTSFETDSWWEPGKWVTGSAVTHDNAKPPNPQGLTGCGKLDFSPEVESSATTDAAESGSGFDFNVDFHDEGLANPSGLAGSEVKKAVVTLPEGVTIDPSVAEGLGVCTPADLDRETLDSAPGDGCPNASKLGTLRLDTPLTDEEIEGSVFLAQQDDPATTTPGAENPFDSLIALYLVLRNTNLGVLVKLPVKVEPDPRTGQLVATLENVPQLPFSHFNFHFREGQRAALISPAACGTYVTTSVFTPWSDPGTPRTVDSSFEITKGVNGGPCPPGGVPPFHPHFEAGAVNNNAGSFSPFDMRLIREDGEQDMTKFSAILPPGELGSLAGVSKCPDSAIATARSKTGKQELASPSCPASSLIGHTLAGAGVGGALTYVGGQIYLGGPYRGDPLSVIAITPAVAGPFDAGTIVVQEALTLNPKTAEVEVDGAHSDPIPHIVKGIVLKLRDLRVYVDRPNFTLNPTSCDESSARSVLFGSYLNALDPSDDRPVELSSRYQAANCLNLGFKPKLALNLKGGTRRGGHPALKAIYTPKKGDANIKGLVVRLPRSAFLDQAHIKTICTRVQFAAGGGNGEQCPAASKYGFVKAWTPLLDEPLEGPVFLRSSNHKLPDLLFALHGLVNIEVDVRIDSSHGGIRATLEDAPDATLSKVVLHMQGAKKGLIINSKNLCGSKNRANVLSTGHNGKQFHAHPLMKAQCGGKRRHKRHH
jgi:hypothetical protein